ncbi:MAG: hypothetical protein WAU01_11925 [Saprospiraceae bacterium]
MPNNSKYKSKKKATLSQSDKNTICALIKSKGGLYEKYQPIHARIATKKEKITTETSSGHETKNIAHPGDYIVKNQTKSEEIYVLTAEKFTKRYQFCHDKEDGWNEYIPTGEVYALELTEEIINDMNWPDKFYILASWGEKMYCAKGDFLASPLDESEFYRIDRKEFGESYRVKSKF